MLWTPVDAKKKRETTLCASHKVFMPYGNTCLDSRLTEPQQQINSQTENRDTPCCGAFFREPACGYTNFKGQSSSSWLHFIGIAQFVFVNMNSNTEDGIHSLL